MMLSWWLAQVFKAKPHIAPKKCGMGKLLSVKRVHLESLLFFTHTHTHTGAKTATSRWAFSRSQAVEADSTVTASLLSAVPSQRTTEAKYHDQNRLVYVQTRQPGFAASHAVAGFALFRNPHAHTSVAHLSCRFQHHTDTPAYKTFWPRTCVQFRRVQFTRSLAG